MNELIIIADFLQERDASFECVCNGTWEYDVNAYIHTDDCPSHMRDHCDIVLRQQARHIADAHKAINDLLALLNAIDDYAEHPAVIAAQKVLS